LLQRVICLNFLPSLHSAKLQARSYDEVTTSSMLGWYLRNAQTRALSHPLPVMRAREIDRWAQGAQYKGLLARNRTVSIPITNGSSSSSGSNKSSSSSSAGGSAAVAGGAVGGAATAAGVTNGLRQAGS
jgi:hypothetical protein